MTRKHFAELAAALKRVRPSKDDPEYKQWLSDVHSIGRACAKFNPSFQHSKFIEEAGVEE